MHDGQELADVVRAIDRAEMEYGLARAQVNAPVFHRAWIAAAGCIDCQSLCRHFGREWQHGVVAVLWHIGGGIFRLRLFLCAYI